MTALLNSTETTSTWGSLLSRRAPNNDRFSDDTTTAQDDVAAEQAKLLSKGSSAGVEAVTTPTGEELDESRTTLQLTTQASDEFMQTRAADRILGMQKWEGYVLEVDGSEFKAELIPYDHQGPTLLADFDVDDSISEGDQADIVVGASFYMCVRTVDTPSGRRTRTSSIRVRRLGVWTAQALQEIQSEAKAMAATVESHFAEH